MPTDPQTLCNAGYRAALALLCQHDAQLAALVATISALAARLQALETRPTPGPCSGLAGCVCPPDSAADE